MAKCMASYSQGKAVIALYIAAKDALAAPFITNNTKRFSFKSGCVVRVEHGEMRCQL